MTWSSDRDRLQQIRRHAALAESDQQNQHHGDIRWLLGWLDAVTAERDAVSQELARVQEGIDGTLGTWLGYALEIQRGTQPGDAQVCAQYLEKEIRDVMNGRDPATAGGEEQGT